MELQDPNPGELDEDARKLPSSGGTRGRAMAFCPSKPGLNPGTDLAFFRSELR